MIRSLFLISLVLILGVAMTAIAQDDDTVGNATGFGPGNDTGDCNGTGTSAKDVQQRRNGRR